MITVAAAIVVIATAILASARWIVRQVVNTTRVIDGQLEAMKDNTKATTQLTERMGELAGTVDVHGRAIEKLDDRVSGLEPRVDLLERASAS